MVKYVKGNLLDSNCDYICHQVNCQGVMGSGIAKQIRERWPDVYSEYVRHVDEFERLNIPLDNLLGHLDIVRLCRNERPFHVINMYAQATYGYTGGRYTSYDAFEYCLDGIRDMVPRDKTIGFPKNIGCGLGGGSWKVISALIEEILGETHEVYIYELEDA